MLLAKTLQKSYPVLKVAHRNIRGTLHAIHNTCSNVSLYKEWYKKIALKPYYSLYPSHSLSISKSSKPVVEGRCSWKSSVLPWLSSCLPWCPHITHTTTAANHRSQKHWPHNFIPGTCSHSNIHGCAVWLDNATSTNKNRYFVFLGNGNGQLIMSTLVSWFAPDRLYWECLQGSWCVYHPRRCVSRVQARMWRRVISIHLARTFGEKYSDLPGIRKFHDFVIVKSHDGNVVRLVLRRSMETVASQRLCRRNTNHHLWSAQPLHRKASKHGTSHQIGVCHPWSRLLRQLHLPMSLLP